MSHKYLGLLLAGLVLGATAGSPAELLVEAEALAELGGWVVDQQSIDVMGSSYLLAHGLGEPVAAAAGTVRFPESGSYRMWVRTRDWVPDHPATPGTFKVAIDGVEQAVLFGTESADWAWQAGGMVEVTDRDTAIELRDQTGFDGRCDALYFTKDQDFTPPNELEQMMLWRDSLLGRPATPADAGSYDLVVVGGGIAGCCAALAAARSGLEVALIHDRPVLGGNASQEVRVHTMGVVFGDIVGEVNTPGYPNGSAESIRYDRLRHAVMEEESRIHLFLAWRAFDAHVEDGSIVWVDARHIQTGEELRFHAPYFVDSTGDGWIGYWAGAKYRMGREGRAEHDESLAPETSDAMTNGSSVMWYSRDVGQPVAFQEVPWAMDVAKDYVATSGDWTWEYGLFLDTIRDNELIRDHLLRAIFGSFYNAKQLSKNANLKLGWVGFIAGKRESRRLIGDYILTEHDLRNHPDFEDTVAIGSWSIDLHYPASEKYDFQTRAEQIGIQKYGIPYRCLYSVNIDNLWMAGRCLSATHIGLGSPRVMNTCGQMGVAVGYAAYLCQKHGEKPRGVYERHIDELRELIGFIPVFVPDGIVAIVDDADPTGVEITGDWLVSTSDDGYYGSNYLHDRNEGKGAKSVKFSPDLPEAGNYEVYLRWTSSDNRATNAPVEIQHASGTTTVHVNQQEMGGVWYPLGSYTFDAGTAGSVTIRNDGTDLYVIADAVCFARPETTTTSFVDRWEVARLLPDF